MPDIFEFGPVKDSNVVYSTGNSVPHRVWKVLLNGVSIGEIETHMHIRKGPDGKLDISFGTTNIVYGPVPGGK